MDTITLTPGQITALLGNTRSRGGYERRIRKFATSGDLAYDVREDMEFASKKTPALLTSFTSNVKRLALANPDWPTIKVVKNTSDDGETDTVFLVNMDAYEASLLNGSDDSDEDDEDNEQ